jgi:hypothetical protein
VCSERQVGAVAERADTCHAACLESSGEYPVARRACSCMR